MTAKSKKAKPTKSTAMIPAAPETFWEVNGEKKRLLLAKLASGMDKKRAAGEVGISRDTVYEWFKHPDFMTRLGEELADHADAVRIRRVKQESRFADKAAVQLERAMNDAAKPNEEQTPAVLARVKTWADQFKTWRAEERIDLGDNVQRSQVSFVGQIGVTSTHQISMRTFLEKRIEAGRVNVETTATAWPLPDRDAGQLVSDALVQILSSDPEVYDLIAEEDREALEVVAK